MGNVRAAEFDTHMNPSPFVRVRARALYRRQAMAAHCGSDDCDSSSSGEVSAGSMDLRCRPLQALE
eukprot:8954377-Alexandrium_andersonii.AAC.1